jgi:formylglycine-generating enzyme
MRWTAWIAAVAGCHCQGSTAPMEADPGPPPWSAAPSAEPERPGMVWIPAGTLIAGTPPGQLPRVADQELPGDRVLLGGFFIDRYAYPGEPGAIPQTGMTQGEARAICEKQGKRLCSELEWERACKGPDNLTYGYGKEYDAAVCGMGVTDALAPNGLNTRCESGFGVRDLHGSAWSWTASPWGRGADVKRVAVRGGNGKEGALIGRCANARAMGPNERDGGVGVRCCAGEVNAAEVELEVTQKADLLWKPPDAKMAEQLGAVVPDELKKTDRGAQRFRVERLWVWRPIGNEELMIAGGCARRPGADACGIEVVRMNDKGPEALAFVSSDEWIPTVGRHALARGVYVYGGDHLGAFRKPVLFDWGKVNDGGKERKKGGGWVR